MNWLAYLIRALSAVPSIVAGIEAIHGSSKSGATKKQMAMEALGLASTVAPVIDPAHQAAIDAATALASTAIDGTVAVMNASGQKPVPQTSAPPLPAPVGGSTGEPTAPAAAAAPSQPGPASGSGIWP